MLGADSGARGSALRVTDQAPSPAPTRTSAAPPSARIVRGVRILIVAMYFPPAGGGGVQRPLRFAQHLVDLGFDVHALAPDDPKWVHRDPTLGFPAGVTVHRARNLGPASRRRGEREFRPRLLLRRALVPDASVLWQLTAATAAARIARRERIDVVLTTSPPGSVHLAGATAKRLAGVRWVADLRDSLAAHPHRRYDIRGERGLARLVGRYADRVVCASRAIAEEMGALVPAARLEVIGNGCDFDDFAGLAYTPGERLRITHTGNFLGRRDPKPFLAALARAPEEVVARFVGDFRPADRAFAEALGLDARVELLPHLPHREALALQRDSEALLLLIPDAGGRGRGVLSAKVFEYLAAERPILAAVPPDGEAAALLRETGAGVVVAPDDVEALAAALAELHGRWRAGRLNGTPLTAETRARLSRRARAEELAEVIRSLN
jgi:glycosyltransferase involved in cell wall biosynthesis